MHTIRPLGPRPTMGVYVNRRQLDRFAWAVLLALVASLATLGLLLIHRTP